MDAHRIHVLDRADDHGVVVAVADDLELELSPPQHRLFEEHLPDRARVERALETVPKVVRVVRDAAAFTAEGKPGAQDHRKPNPLGRRHARRDVGDDLTRGHLQPGGGHRRPERLAVLGAMDRVSIGADQLHPVPLEDSRVVKLHREVERGLTAQGRQERVGSLDLDDALDRGDIERLDVRAVGDRRVRHDRRRVRIDEDNPVPLLAERTAGLGARIVELAGLPDHDRAAAKHKNRGDVGSARH